MRERCRICQLQLASHVSLDGLTAGSIHTPEVVCPDCGVVRAKQIIYDPFPVMPEWDLTRVGFAFNRGRSYEG